MIEQMTGAGTGTGPGKATFAAGCFWGVELGQYFRFFYIDTRLKTQFLFYVITSLGAAGTQPVGQTRSLSPALQQR
jgi:hypothetical protein